MQMVESEMKLERSETNEKGERLTMRRGKTRYSQEFDCVSFLFFLSSSPIFPFFLPASPLLFPSPTFLLQVTQVKFSNVSALAQVVSGLNRYHSIGPRLADSVLEEVRRCREEGKRK